MEDTVSSVEDPFPRSQTMSETKLDFDQVDVFGSARYLGNPLAVVHEAVDFSTEEMARFARWTNLSETKIGRAHV